MWEEKDVLFDKHNTTFSQGKDKYYVLLFLLGLYYLKCFGLLVTLKGMVRVYILG
jgi:hypothetical protein